ncbi:DUF72 domain-containing protein [Candidatus Parcubacteria bacterium]|nr:DUF72 domain-containing protein [Candidatus Parcubacteria bacterium]
MKREIKIGCCGFPEKKEKYYQKFKLVELQTTFYELPAKIETAKNWRKEAPKDFEFTLKAFQVITHEISSPTYKRLKKKFVNPKNYGFFKNTKEVFEAWEKTKKIAEILGAKIIVFQTPASFLPEKQNIENLKNFFRKIKSRKFIFVWEPRGNWDKDLIEDLCKQLNLVHCVDPFKERPRFGKINYFRLHGLPGYNLKYKYKIEDLKKLFEFCEKRENYVLFNNLNMLKDAQTFQKIVYG